MTRNFFILLKENNMNQSTDVSETTYADFFAIFCFSCLGAFIIAFSFTCIYDVVNLYSLKQDGFNLSSNFPNIGSIDGNIFGAALSFVVGSFLIGAIIFGVYSSMRKYLKQYLSIVFTFIALFSIFVVNFTSKEDLLASSSQEIYNRTVSKYENKDVFLNSTPAKEYKLALDTKNFEALKVFINNPKKLQGLDETEMFNKLLTVQNISNKSVREDFNNIYNDRYITQEEYESFKKNAMESIMQTMTADVLVNPSNDKMLLGNL